MLKGRLSRKRNDTFQEPTINVTPLIDVVFVLLISFIIVAPLLEKDTVELASSGGVSSHETVRSQDTSSPIVIHVRRDNSVLLSGKPIEIPDLSRALYDLKKRYPTARPQIFHDKKAAFGTYQAIKNSLENAGFSEMDIVLAPT